MNSFIRRTTIRIISLCLCSAILSPPVAFSQEQQGELACLRIISDSESEYREQKCYTVKNPGPMTVYWTNSCRGSQWLTTTLLEGRRLVEKCPVDYAAFCDAPDPTGKSLGNIRTFHYNVSKKKLISLKKSCRDSGGSWQAARR
jgi:hypothetical protein